MTQHILLTGAGFSRNWGGWLANEAFEYLLGSRDIRNEMIQGLLWEFKETGGFEAAYEKLLIRAAEYRAWASVVPSFNEAIRRMFADMNEAFIMPSMQFEFSNQVRYSVRSFLVRFDAIFTLNQDLLLEQCYLNQVTSAYSVRSWNGGYMPGMQRWPGDPEIKWAPKEPFVVDKKLQPYFKLHGSSDWFETINGQQMLVIGGNKESEIERHAILRWNHKQFREHLLQPHTQLMVIGYSFRDKHINDVISMAADTGSLKLFIIDPDGVDVLDRDFRNKQSWKDTTTRGPIMNRLQKHLIGGSRRTLREIFGGSDRVEHGKVMRFFE